MRIIKENFKLLQETFTGSHPSSIKNPNLLFFLIFISFLFLLRAPEIVIQFGRFWAEEGERWFRVTQKVSTFEMLTYAARNDNINMFFTNFIFAIVRFIEPKYAPLFTTLSSHLATLFCLCIILKNSFYFYLSSRNRYLLCIIFFFASSNHPEMWLNTINTMTYFGMIAPFLLFTNFQNLSRKNLIFNLIFLIFAFSTSPYCMFVIPLFIIKFIITKKKIDLYVAVLGSAILSYEMYILINHYISDLVNPKRLSVVKEFNFSLIIYNYFKFLFFSIFGGNVLAIFGKIGIFNNIFTQIVFIVLCLGLLIKISLVSKYSFLFFAISIYISFLVMNFSFNGSLVGRYGSASMYIIYASLVISIQFKRNLLAGIIIAFSILAGTFYTLPVNTTIQNIFLSGPSWFDEYKKWEEDKTYEPLYWSGNKVKGTNIYK